MQNKCICTPPPVPCPTPARGITGGGGALSAVSLSLSTLRACPKARDETQGPRTQQLPPPPPPGGAPHPRQEALRATRTWPQQLHRMPQGTRAMWMGGLLFRGEGGGWMGGSRRGWMGAPLCDIPSGCFFTGPWTVTRSSLRMLRRVAAFCRPLQPVLLLVSFPRSRSPVVGVLGWCWMLFACQRRPVVGILRMCWLLPGSFDCFCCPPPPV